jgi:hypothetical protein
MTSAETGSGGGLQEELSTNPLFFQHFQKVASETLDGRASADTFDPEPQQTHGSNKTQTT